MLGRREFLQRAAVATALLGIPRARAEEAFARGPDALPPRKLLDTDPERYWAELRRQWLLAADRINLNCGAVGCTPLPVLRATIDHLLSAESFREPDLPWFGYDENAHIRSTRDALAEFLNCKRDELALTRNCSEANNVVANGLDLKAGDEVLLTDQEHPSGHCPWEQRAARYGGVKLNFVKLPRPPESVEEIVKLFEAALTPRTRLIVFSHITWVTGLRLPAKEICQLARKNGILTHIDGAHGVGQIHVDVRDLGCDFYTTNGHKWLMGPKGCGALFIREEHLERLWAHTVVDDWRNYKLKAYRFSKFGTSNLSVIVGLKSALDFFRAIGPERVYARIHELGRKVRDRLREDRRARLLNASADHFHAGLVSFAAAKGDLKRVKAECDKRHIRIRYWEGGERIRVSTGIFTQPTELNAFFDALERGLGG